MKKIKCLFLIILLTVSFGKTCAQTIDTLSVSPNPFNHLATIHFEIVQADTIMLQLLNLFGQIKMTFLQDTVLSSGAYDVNFVGDSLAKGVYIILLNIGSSKNIGKKVVKYDSVVNISQNTAEENRIRLFPNPTNDLLMISEEGNKHIIITDINGRIVKSFSTDEQVISLLDLANGQYFITILTSKNEMLTTQKIVK